MSESTTGLTIGGRYLRGEVIDLSQQTRAGMLVPPALQAAGQGVRIERLATHEERGFVASTYQTVIHAGTHVDAPLHFVAGGKLLHELGIGPWVGFGYVADCREVGANQQISRELLEARAEAVRPGEILLLCTGWGEQMWGRPEYWSDSPTISEDAATWCVERGVKTVGFDCFQEQAAKRTRIEPADYVVHKVLLGQQIGIVEHLTNLSRIVGEAPYVVILPVNLVDAEGAPARAIAIV